MKYALALAFLLISGCVSAPTLLNCHETCAFDNMKCVSATVSNVPYSADVTVKMQDRILPKQFQCVVDDTRLADYEALRKRVIEREEKRLSVLKGPSRSTGVTPSANKPAVSKE